MDCKLPPAEQGRTVDVLEEDVERVLALLEADVAHDVVVRQPLVERDLVFERVDLVLVLAVDLLDKHLLHGHQVARLFLEADHNRAVGAAADKAAFGPLDLAVVMAGPLALQVTAVDLGAELPLAFTEVVEVRVDVIVSRFVLFLISVEQFARVLLRIRVTDWLRLDGAGFRRPGFSGPLSPVGSGQLFGSAADDRIRTCDSHARKLYKQSNRKGLILRSLDNCV